MRCEECGHDLNGIGDTAPCPECGVVTPVGRRLAGAMPGGWRVVMLFGWPPAVMLVLGLGLALLAGIVPDGAGIAIGTFVGVLVFVFVVAPLNTARHVNRLMQRLPRRLRAAPLLLLIPRSVAVPVLAGLATVPIMAAIAFGGCMIVVLSMESASRAPAPVVPAQPAAQAAPGGAAHPPAAQGGTP